MPLFARRTSPKKENNRDEHGDHKEALYVSDDEDFLQLVDKTYNDNLLFEWEPAPPLHQDPNEPGYLGISRRSRFTTSTLTDSYHILGKPVFLSAADKIIADKRFPAHNINVFVSEMVSMNRTLKELRHPK